MYNKLKNTLDVRFLSLQLGTKLADLRKRNGYSQEALAEKLGISRQAVSKWERGESTPDTDTLIELSRLYGVSLDELVGNNPAQQQEEKKEFNPPAENTQQEKKGPVFPGLSNKLLKFPMPVLVVAVYIFLGFSVHLWHPTWLMFLLIPAYYHFAIAARAKTMKGFLLGMPVIEAAVILFLILGLAVNAWKYAWILFIMALFYYWAVATYVKKD